MEGQPGHIPCDVSPRSRRCTREECGRGSGGEHRPGWAGRLRRSGEFWGSASPARREPRAARRKAEQLGGGAFGDARKRSRKAHHLQVGAGRITARVTFLYSPNLVTRVNPAKFGLLLGVAVMFADGALVLLVRPDMRVREGRRARHSLLVHP